jgi:hypothetical protein
MNSTKEYFDAIAQQLKSFDKKGAADSCEQLIKFLFTSEENFKLRDAEKTMQQLRNKRMFLWMQKLGDALIQTGRISFKIRRLYAQSLIDQNNLTGAIAILKELAADTAAQINTVGNAKDENAEAKGLLGRSYKQLYVNANNPSATYNIGFLKESINSYLNVYVSDPENRTWHGINSVAVIKRGERDKINLSEYPSADELAGKVLKTISDKYDNENADAWDFATAAEACLALNKQEEALKWLSGYARMPYCDAFELSSTLRQLEEVWQLDMNSEMGKLLLPILRAELLKREGGNVIMDVAEIQKQRVEEDKITDRYSSIKDENVVAKPGLEKVFGKESYKSYRWFMKAGDRCLAVARIGRDAEDEGFGTGFLLKGKALNDQLGEELVLITNAHVVSNDPKEESLYPDEAVVVFEALNRNVSFKNLEIIWSSPSSALDCTVLRFNKDDQPRLTELTRKVDIYPVSQYLPQVQDPATEKIYIIGHPKGGPLQISFQDNLLIDYESPKIHYRTPTVGGSSGSPAFNENWDLIGLHHAGSKTMPRLNRKSGTYEANEGIWIQAVRDAMTKKTQPVL